MIYIHLDGMTRINQMYGHLAGDQALAAMAEILRQSCRGADVIARLAGDEFAVLAPSTSAAHEADIVARLRTNAEAFNRQKKAAFKLALSLGAVPYDPDQPCSLAELIARADEKMREHKRRGVTDGRGDEAATQRLARQAQAAQRA